MCVQLHQNQNFWIFCESLLLIFDSLMPKQLICGHWFISKTVLEFFIKFVDLILRYPVYSQIHFPLCIFLYLDIYFSLTYLCADQPIIFGVDQRHWYHDIR